MENARRRQTSIRTGMTVAILALGLLFVSYGPAAAARDDMSAAQGVVDRARVTFNDFMRDSNYGWLHENLDRARGIVIFPQVLKGGFIFGGSGGTGIFVVRDERTGDWSEPAFYTIGSVTFGLQIGGEAAEVIMLAMTQRAVDTLLTSSVKLGGDVSVALGPVGGGAKANVAVPNVTADFISFAKSKGLYAGLNLEGSVVAVRDRLNRSYYGKDVRPSDIIVNRGVHNRGAAELQDTLKKRG